MIKEILSGTCDVMVLWAGRDLMSIPFDFVVVAALTALSMAAGCSRGGSGSSSHEAGGNIVEIETEQQFEKQVLSAKGPVLVDFYAVWCPPCRQVAPILDSLAAEYKGEVAFIKVDVDKNAGLAATWGVEAIPTIFLFVDGKKTKRLVGLGSRSELREMLDSAAGR